MRKRSVTIAGKFSKLLGFLFILQLLLFGICWHSTACEQLSPIEQTDPAVGKQSTQLNCPTYSVELPTKLMPAKVVLEVDERLGAERYMHLMPEAQCRVISTSPVALGLVSLLRMSTRQSVPRLRPQALMFCDVPAEGEVQQMIGWSRSAQMAKRTPQQSGVGLKLGAVPKRDWLEGSNGLQKLIKQPDKMANYMLISIAHRAAAKLLVIPSMPESLVSLISLMPTKQLNALIGLPFWSTNKLFKNCLEQVQLSRLGMVACEVLRNTMHRKVKTTQKLQVMYCSCATQVLLASCVMPGPVMQIPQLFWMEEMSLMKLVTVQVQLQMVAARSPQSSSSRLMQSQEKRLKQVLKFLQQLEVVVKLLFSRSKPRSAPQELAQLQRQLFIWEMMVELRARSSVQVTLPPQMAEEQLYLQPRGT